ncbi:peptidoglycan N-acetylmuramoylhydrolase [Candidatus Vecturithrix granuli]|uniref:Peptidoglycan N-acetylmuramoylhydrolase n=1 Tax=Vecturithrix granuli TaxID=1499967 RepID=A0A081C387_VECG1|nr:peptidoglycan N-acetylmuramoylhydrolase [Candidatus Vecturithrix granuli]
MIVKEIYRRRFKLLFFLNIGILWTFTIPVSEATEIYKYVKNGVVHYGNQPPTDVSYETIGGTGTSHTQVQPLSMTKMVSSSSLASMSSHLTTISRIANAHSLSPELVKAIVKVESNFNHKAVSPKGAKGLMQLMPATAKRFGVEDIFDPEENITGGVKFLKYLFDEFGEENLDLVLAGYNAGEEAVRKHGNKIPPYAETQNYVKQVKALYLVHSPYSGTKTKTIYKYVDKNGVLTFTNVPRVN